MKISVVIPVRNEEDSIRTLLDCVLGQTRKPDEVVITDGGSTDMTPSIVEEYVRRGAPVRLIREAAALPGRGRNVAAARASFEWLAFADAGTRPAPGWLEALAERVERDPAVEVVYGNWESITDTFFKECAAIAYVHVTPIEVEGETIPPPWIASALIRREVWSAVGGFADHLRSAEDLLFQEKIKEGEFRVAYAPRAVVGWTMQPTLWRTFKRFVTYSRHNLRAGFGAQWQSAIVTRYALLSLCALPALVFGLRWLAVPAALWLLMLAARAVVALRRNRAAYPAGPLRNFLRFLLLVPLLATIDAATILGTLHWLAADKLRPGAATADAGGGGA